MPGVQQIIENTMRQDDKTTATQIQAILASCSIYASLTTIIWKKRSNGLDLLRISKVRYQYLYWYRCNTNTIILVHEFLCVGISQEKPVTFVSPRLPHDTI